MSKFLALAYVALAGAATVQQHFATTDPHTMLESMRALAKEAADGKIDGATFAVVAEHVAEIRRQLMASMEQCINTEDAAVFAALGKLVELNTQAANDVNTENSNNASITGEIGTDLTPCRDLEAGLDEDRTRECGEVCDLVARQICTPPADGDWTADLEPCCREATNQSDVEAPMPHHNWIELEEYMDCLNNYVSTMDNYFLDAEDCKNASEAWSDKRDACIGINKDVEQDMCTNLEWSGSKCDRYNLAWGTGVHGDTTVPRAGAIGSYWTTYENAMEIQANTHAQYEALRTVECLFAAIQTNETSQIAAACQACEDALDPAVCPGPECPPEIVCEHCPTPPAPKTQCQSTDMCAVCTDAYRNEFYDCPMDCASNPEAVVPEQCRLLRDHLGCTAFPCDTVCQEAGKYDEFTCGVNGNFENSEL